jgi:NADH dehydrogenase
MALERLHKPGVEVRTSAHVAEIPPNGVKLTDGTVVLAELTVWAAGVKTPDVLTRMDGLETNRLNQLSVLQSLQTTLDQNVFALGDCAACPWPEGKSNVPPRAQAAHQQASHMARQIQRRLAGRPLELFRYRDFGSLVSLGRQQSVGNLAGLFSARSVFVEGLRADDVSVDPQDASARTPQLRARHARHADRNARGAHRAAGPNSNAYYEPNSRHGPAQSSDYRKPPL